MENTIFVKIDILDIYSRVSNRRGGGRNNRGGGGFLKFNCRGVGIKGEGGFFWTRKKKNDKFCNFLQPNKI